MIPLYCLWHFSVVYDIHHFRVADQCLMFKPVSSFLLRSLRMLVSSLSPPGSSGLHQIQRSLQIACPKNALRICFNINIIPSNGFLGERRRSLRLKQKIDQSFFLSAIPPATGVMSWKGRVLKMRRLLKF